MWGEYIPVNMQEAVNVNAGERIDINLPATTTAHDFEIQIRTLQTGATVTVTITTKAGAVEVEFLDNASTSTVDTAFTTEGFDVTVTGSAGNYNILFNDYTVDSYIVADATDDTSPAGSEVTITNYPSTATAYYANKVKLYSIEIIDLDGNLITEILDWSNGKFRDATNEAGELSFRMRGTDTTLVSYVFSAFNRLRLRDRWGTVLGVFKVTKPRRVRQGDAVFVDVVAQTMLQQLTREVVLDYKKTPSDLATVYSVMTDLFALQLNSRPIGLGAIDAPIAASLVNVNFEKLPLLDAVGEVQKQLSKDLAGYFYVNANRQFVWRLAIGTDDETIEVGERLQGIDAEVDYDSLITRLYMYGEGQDEETALTLIDAGLANEYKDAATTATYGVIPLIHRDRRIRRPETLLAVTNRILEEFSTPPTVYKINVLDLAKSDSVRSGWDFEDIYTGSKYRIIDADLDIDDTVYTQVVEYDLDNPVPVRVELGNKKKSLSEIINSIYDATVQPLDVDGDLYPTMGRNYSEGANRNNGERRGDTRWTSKGQMHDGDDWQDLGGSADVIVESVTTLPAIPSQNDNGDDVEVTVFSTTDDQRWKASSLDTIWSPETYLTTRTGAPGS